MNESQAVTPVQIFFDADLVVQSVIFVLVLASAYSWSVIIGRSIAILLERRKIRAVVKGLASIENLNELREVASAGDGMIHGILQSIATEWKWSSRHAGRDYGDIRHRLSSVANLVIEQEYAQLAANSAWLATIGNSAPFLGLFGTVWGIMNSFIGISQAQNTSLVVVAPGMAEALFATAAALLCAIPASIGYNRIVQALALTDQEWRAAVGRIEIAISRHYNIIR